MAPSAMIQSRILLASSTLLVLMLGTLTVWAQHSNVACGDWSTWMLNEHGETPCDVWARIGALCSGGDHTVLPLRTEDYIYLAPTRSQCTPCQCNSVAYTLMSACTVCQYRDARARLQFDNQQYWAFGCDTSGVSGSHYRSNGTMSVGLEEAAADADVSIPIWARVPVAERPGWWNEQHAYQVALAALPTSSIAATASYNAPPPATSSPTAFSITEILLPLSLWELGAARGVIMSILGLALGLAVLLGLFCRRLRRDDERAGWRLPGFENRQTKGEIWQSLSPHSSRVKDVDEAF